jgi:hypothetical protein
MSDVHRKDVELFQGLEPVLGAHVATLLLERLPPARDDLATRGDLERFATKDDFASLPTHADLERFATKDDLGAFATREYLDLRLAASTAELKGFVHEVVGTTVQAQTRTILVGMAGIMAAATTLAAALGQLV